MPQKRVAREVTKGAVIAEVLTQVQRALQNAAERTAGMGLPPLATVTLTLQTVITVAGGVKFKFLVFSFGQTWEKERSHELVLTLAPPKARLGMKAALADELADAIVEAAIGVKDGLAGSPALALTALKSTVSFVVTGDTSAGAEFALEPIKIELKGDLKTKAIHKIELTFKAAEKVDS
jgi:hypothetical protein